MSAANSTVEKSATRDALADILPRLARKNSQIFAFDCDLGRSTRSHSITKAAPARFIDLGIAEQDMISTAAGLASAGKTVFVNTFAVFLAGRAYDQIRQQVALPGSSVILCGSSAGLTQGPDGATHQSVTDINLMRGLPNMQVFVPADKQEAIEVIKYAAKQKKPAYIRLSRYETPPLLPLGARFVPGAMQKIKDGQDGAVISCGPLLRHCLEAVKKLNNKGLDIALYNSPSVKPIDKSTIADLASCCRQLYTVEEHSVTGGLGSAVAEILTELKNRKAALTRIGVQDCFGESGTADELLNQFKLDAVGIAEQILQDMAAADR